MQGKPTIVHEMVELFLLIITKFDVRLELDPVLAETAVVTSNMPFLLPLAGIGIAIFFQQSHEWQPHILKITPNQAFFFYGKNGCYQDSWLYEARIESIQ